ncbi:unnamed protein product [Pleuronectes platessa]|uniref:Uncharacterized protein n=1 Tax=Pleuronectes platessa TaxID=8262 RepID=A0A9N7ZDX1_PLEPL|nr:unnamed protein product [Pleuronectes platessa]
MVKGQRRRQSEMRELTERKMSKRKSPTAALSCFSEGLSSASGRVWYSLAAAELGVDTWLVSTNTRSVTALLATDPSHWKKLRAKISTHLMEGAIREGEPKNHWAGFYSHYFLLLKRDAGSQGPQPVAEPGL